MTLITLGELIPASDQEGTLESAPVPIPLLNELPVPFHLLNISETDKPEIERAVATFLSLGAEARALAATAVYNNFLEFREACCYDDVGCEPESEAKIWRHVRPSEIDVFRRREDGQIYLQVMAECDWEPEHGLHLLFDDTGSLLEVSDQGGGLAWQDS